MNYSVYDPPLELRPFIKCFWTLEDGAVQAPVKQRVVPDGCMEMIFHYGDLYEQHFDDGTFEIQPRSFIFGQITKYIEIAPTGVTGIVAARFLPEGLSPFLSTPVSSLDNKALSLEKIFGENGRRLERKVIAFNTTSQRIKIIEEFLLMQLANPRTIDSITRACIDTILESQGQIGVVQLAEKTKINRRNIERKFNTVIGLSPKQLSKVVRLQAALKMLGQKKFNNLTALAHESGYYDQAHFIKDFRDFTGMSPKSFFADNMKLSNLFIATE